jgi:hypothetical protein
VATPPPPARMVAHQRQPTSTSRPTGTGAWRAGCVVGTSGQRRGPGSRTHRKVGTASRPDPIKSIKADGQIRWHPDEAVTDLISAIFQRFAVCGSVRAISTSSLLLGARKRRARNSSHRRFRDNLPLSGRSGGAGRGAETGVQGNPRDSIRSPREAVRRRPTTRRATARSCLASSAVSGRTSPRPA